MPHEIFNYMDMMQPMGAPVVQVMNPVTMCIRAPCPNTENAPTPAPAPNVAYCIGGEGTYDGVNTFWIDSANKGCRVNNSGKSMPYGRPISKAEYHKYSQGVLCNDGFRDKGGGRRALCDTHGGIYGEAPPPPPPKPKFMPSYVNKATYSYPKCKTGYVSVWTNAVPPDNQSCMDPLEVKWMNDNKIVF